jgi:hypothetical protein
MKKRGLGERLFFTPCWAFGGIDAGLEGKAQNGLGFFLKCLLYLATSFLPETKTTTGVPHISHTCFFAVAAIAPPLQPIFGQSSDYNRCARCAAR